MLQTNLQLPMVFSEPVACYVRTTSTALAGYRLDHEAKNRLTFIFLGDDPDKDYANSVLEIYTAQEDAFFRRMNAVLFQEGKIRPYSKTEKAVDLTNYMDDTEVLRIASIRNRATLSRELSDLTSVPTLNRVLKAAEDIGSAKWVLTLITARIEELGE